LNKNKAKTLKNCVNTTRLEGATSQSIEKVIICGGTGSMKRRVNDDVLLMSNYGDESTTKVSSSSVKTVLMMNFVKRFKQSCLATVGGDI